MQLVVANEDVQQLVPDAAVGDGAAGRVAQQLIKIAFKLAQPQRGWAASALNHGCMAGHNHLVGQLTPGAHAKAQVGGQLEQKGEGEVFGARGLLVEGQNGIVQKLK